MFGDCPRRWMKSSRRRKRCGSECRCAALGSELNRKRRGNWELRRLAASDAGMLALLIRDKLDRRGYLVDAAGAATDKSGSGSLRLINFPLSASAACSARSRLAGVS